MAGSYLPAVETACLLPSLKPTTAKQQLNHNEHPAMQRMWHLCGGPPGKKHVTTFTPPTPGGTEKKKFAQKRKPLMVSHWHLNLLQAFDAAIYLNIWHVNAPHVWMLLDEQTQRGENNMQIPGNNKEILASFFYNSNLLSISCPHQCPPCSYALSSPPPSLSLLLWPQAVWI